MSRHYELSVPSDGQTIDTGYGPVDTIVIERALRGLPAQPTQAEASYLGKQFTTVFRHGFRHQNAR